MVPPYRTIYKLRLYNLIIPSTKEIYMIRLLLTMIFSKGVGMKKRFFIKLFHTIFFILVGMGIMYLYMQKQTDPMDQIQKLMSQNDVDPDEAIYIYLKKNPDLTDSQKGDLFLNAINNFTLSEGVFSSMVEMAEDELSSEELTSMIGKLRTRMQQLQHFYYSLKLGNGPEYFTVIKELEFIDKSLITNDGTTIKQIAEP